MADVKVSGLPSDTSLDGNHYTILNDPTGPTTKRTLLSTLAAFFFNQTNIPDGSGSPRTRDSEMMFDHVNSGCVWSGDAYGSTRLASMTSGVVYINGRRLTISAVVSRTFTASKDTYIDILDNGDGTATIVYTEVANNAASPALAANSIRIGIIITGAGNIANVGSVNQGQETKVLPIASSVPYAVSDSLGNLICGRDPNRKLLGFRRRITNFAASAQAQITELSVPIKIPTGRKIKWSFSGFDIYANTNSVCQVLLWDGAVGGTQIDGCLMNNAGSAGMTFIPAIVGGDTLTAGSHTINASLQSTAGTSTLDGSVGTPLKLMVELQ